jgi:hypothetical protein
LTALASVDTFKVEVAARLYRPAHTKPDFSHVGPTACIASSQGKALYFSTLHILVSIRNIELLERACKKKERKLPIQRFKMLIQKKLFFKFLVYLLKE